MPDPIKVNRHHSVWPREIVAIERVLMSKPGGWLQIYTRDGNRYQTELSDKVDPECPVDLAELCSKLEAVTGLKALTKNSPAG